MCSELQKGMFAITKMPSNFWNWVQDLSWGFFFFFNCTYIISTLIEDTYINCIEVKIRWSMSYHPDAVGLPLNDVHLFITVIHVAAIVEIIQRCKSTCIYFPNGERRAKMGELDLSAAVKNASWWLWAIHLFKLKHIDGWLDSSSSSSNNFNLFFISTAGRVKKKKSL